MVICISCSVGIGARVVTVTKPVEMNRMVGIVVGVGVPCRLIDLSRH